MLNSFPWDPEEKTTEIVGFLSAVDEVTSPEKYDSIPRTRLFVKEHYSCQMS